MSQKEKQSIKPFITGAAAGCFLPLVIWELIQGGVAYAVGAANLTFKISGIKLYSAFNLDKGIFTGAIIYFIPYLLSLVSITLAFKYHKRVKRVFTRLFLIAMPLVLSGFLIIDVFYGAFSIILKFNSDNDWVQLTSLFGLSESGSIIFIFLVIIFTSGYLNLLLKRILNYIKI